MQKSTGSLDPRDETPSTDFAMPLADAEAIVRSTLFAADAPAPVDPPAVSPAPRTRRELRELEARLRRESVAAERSTSASATNLLSVVEISIDDLIAGPSVVDLPDAGRAAASEQVPDVASDPSRSSLRSRSAKRNPSAEPARADRSARTGKPARSGKAARSGTPARSGGRARRAVVVEGRRTPVGRRRAMPAAVPRVAAELTATAVPVRARVAGIRRRVVSNLITASAMAGVGLILVATTVPANAFSRPDLGADAEAARSSQTLEAQKLVVDESEAETVTRDAFSVVSLQQQVAARGANRLLNYTNNPAGTIQWPFPSGVPITSGFGGRHVAGCGFCSTYHEGLDFTPGTGTPIASIADGVVSKVELGGAFGNHVVVDHVVNGQKVQSLYAHMQYGSIKVAVGQAVTVGQQVGAVGSTGASTGAHLHLEIHLDGVPVDPFAWLQANAN